MTYNHTNGAGETISIETDTYKLDLNLLKTAQMVPPDFDGTEIKHRIFKHTSDGSKRNKKRI